MRMGELDQRITVLAPVTAKNGLGEARASSWDPVTTVWAKHVPLSDGERWRAGAVEQKADARFTVRYSPTMAAVDGTHRLTFAGATWQVTGVKPVGRRRWLELTAWRMPAA